MKNRSTLWRVNGTINECNNSIDSIPGPYNSEHTFTFLPETELDCFRRSWTFGSSICWWWIVTVPREYPLTHTTSYWTWGTVPLAPSSVNWKKMGGFVVYSLNIEPYRTKCCKRLFRWFLGFFEEKRLIFEK